MDVESKIPAFLEAQRNLVKPVPPQNGQNGSSTPQSSPTQPGSKRKAPQFSEVSKAGGKKRKVAGGPVQAKNAVVTLNEYKAGLEYVMVEQRGPVHQPTFVIGVTVNGAQFLGEGGVSPCPGPWLSPGLCQGPGLVPLCCTEGSPTLSSQCDCQGPRSWPS
eukprot:GFUD01050727.1.p1 GENE.GFUD01050727.1~~GFUD01050727.1.p1  ORF type:complete len:161 (+),score=46.78 GFUD01050727.1:40-522(+)